MPVYLLLVIALATLVVPFFLGAYLGKKLRMPDHGWKIGLCFFTALASIVILLLGPPIKLGVDLRGGVILTYEIDRTKMEADKKVDMEKMVAAVARRVNPGGQKEVTIRPSGIDQIEIIIPEVDEAEVARVEKIISRAGSLEFRILANRRDHSSLIDRAMSESPTKKQIFNSQNELMGWWVPVQEGQEKDFSNNPDSATREIKHGDKTILEVLVNKDNQDVDGRYLTRAERDTDPKTGKPCVGFGFDSTGAQLFGKLTGDNCPDPATGYSRRLGVILDGALYSAPTIQSTITDRGVITGSFTEQDVKDQVSVLNAGSLPATLTKEPISKLYSGATLGQDTIQKSARAMIIACILVPLFMLWYYRFAGVVANIALILNMLMLVAIMVAIKAAFTLTGLAGLALTVGMAVDNNVLVYERLREERERGATLRMAIRNAFHRASATIIDCNLSHLIAATVLYVVGTDQIRGFAVTLWLGVAISMYTSVFVARVIFEIAEKRQWLRELKMMHLVRHTNIDFMGWFPTCATFSVLITVIGLGIAVHRGKGLFDIDFTGGVSVQAVFKEPQDTGEVRKLLSSRPDEDRLPDLAISDVRMADQKEGLQFVVNTSEPDMKKVEKELTDVFGEKLVRNEIVFTPPALIESVKITEPAEKKAGDEKPTAEKPAAEKPAETPQPKPEAPAKDSQSRTDLPSNRLLAAADLEGVMLALADEPTAEPAAEEPVEAKPAEAVVEKPAEAKPAEAAQPVETPQPKTVPKNPAAEEKAAEKAEEAEKKPPQTPVAGAFVGGSETELTFTIPLNYKAAEDLVNQAIEDSKVSTAAVAIQLYNKDNREGESKPFAKWTVRMQLPPDKAAEVLAQLEQQLKSSPFFPAASTIGGAVAGSTRVIAVYALIASWMGIAIYLWVRFQGVAFGLAAVLSLIHDILVMLGAVAVSFYVPEWLGSPLMIEPFKINLPIVAAFLTIIGYSVNDTIVVFDRIREVRGKDPRLTAKMVNDSTNQTMSRTLLTSLTVLLVVVVLYFAGGDALHGFAFSLIVGVLTGTYSSIYVAAPTLLWMIGKHKERQVA